MECPICEGEGGWNEDVGLDYTFLYTDCPYCGGTGKIFLFKWLRYMFWTECAPDWLFDLLAEITHWKEMRKLRKNNE